MFCVIIALIIVIIIHFLYLYIDDAAISGLTDQLLLILTDNNLEIVMLKIVLLILCL